MDPSAGNAECGAERTGASGISSRGEAVKHDRYSMSSPGRASSFVDRMTKKRLVYICDWLPPDFGAVGQYAMFFAREWASDGWAVTLVGLTSGGARREAAEAVGEGTLEV